MPTVSEKDTVFYRDVIENAHRANVAKIEQLIRDANSKVFELQKTGNDPNGDRAYWAGVAFGLRRALNVLNGNG